MIVKARTNKRLTAAFTIASIIGILFLCRIVIVLGMSAYMNAESTKEDGNQELVAVYYIGQAITGDFMEPYVAYYNAGTALAKANQPQAAEHHLGTALAKVDNDYNECYIRNNLAKVQELLGDYYMLDGSASTAETYYAKAVTTVMESPGVCFPPPPPSPSEGEGDEESPLAPEDQKPEDSENGESLKETQERSEKKEGEAKEAQGESAEGKDKVEEEMDQSKSEIQNQEDVSEQKENQSENLVDKPW